MNKTNFNQSHSHKYLNTRSTDLPDPNCTIYLVMTAFGEFRRRIKRFESFIICATYHFEELRGEEDENIVTVRNLLEPGEECFRYDQSRKWHALVREGAIKGLNPSTVPTPIQPGGPRPIRGAQLFHPQNV